MLGPIAAAQQTPSVSVTADHGIAAGRDIHAQTITIGLTPVQLREMMLELHAQESASVARVEALSAQLGVTTAAIATFFRILDEQQVPIEALPQKLAEIAERHRALLTQLEAVQAARSDDPAVTALKEQAAQAITAGDYDRAEALLRDAEATDLRAAEQAQQVAEQARAAAAQRRLAAAATRAQRGELSLTRLDYAAAAEHYRTAAGLVPAGDAPIRAGYLNGWGFAAERAGHYPEAQGACEEALAIREQALGPAHPDVAESLNNLAVLYRAQGRFAEAEPLHRRALAIREQALGPQHPDVATSLNNLATLYHDQGRSAEAQPLLQRALLIFTAALGEGHPYTQSVQQKLAVLAADRALGHEDGPAAGQVLVVRVLPDSQAARIGVQPGDVIDSYDGSRITDPQSLVAAVQRPGEAARELVVRREGQELRFQVAPGRLGVELRQDAAPAGAGGDPAPGTPAAGQR